jgi:hypothetical protein
MKYIRPLLSLSLVAIAIVGSGCNQSSSVKYDGGMFEEATLTASPTAFSFPNTALGEQSAATKIILSNIGFESTGPVSHVIDGSTEFVITSSTCGQPLAFQNTCEVSVVFKPLIAGSSKMARLTATATPGKVFTVLLYGTSMQPASARLDPTVYDFFPAVAIPAPGDTQQMMYPVSAPFTVSNTGGTIIGPLSAIIEGTDAGDFAVASNGCSTLAAGATCAITVRFKPTSAGAKTANLSVSGPGLDLPPATLSGIGAETAKISLTPLQQNFGMIPIGMKSAFSFDVSNMGGADAGKINVSLEGLSISEFMVTPDASCNDPLKPNFTCSITVTFSPTLIGTKTASLRVTASPGGFAKAELTATALTNTGTGQIVLSSPSPDPFGSVTLGESSSGFFIVENRGTVAAGKIMPAVSGSSANEFTVQDNGCPDMLPAGQQCAVTVRFTPQAIGSRTSNLQVTAIPGGFASLVLRGTALAGALLRISPFSRQFSDRVIGSTSNIQTQTFTITNGGSGLTGPLAVSVESLDPNHVTSFELFGANDCQGQSLVQGRTCRVDVRFLPKIRGFLNASIVVNGMPGGIVRGTMTGRGCQGSVSNANCQ